MNNAKVSIYFYKPKSFDLENLVTYLVETTECHKTYGGMKKKIVSMSVKFTVVLLTVEADFSEHVR